LFPEILTGSLVVLEEGLVVAGFFVVDGFFVVPDGVFVGLTVVEPLADGETDEGDAEDGVADEDGEEDDGAPLVAGASVVSGACDVAGPSVVSGAADDGACVVSTGTPINAVNLSAANSAPAITVATG
jgi:hypothetical protein